MAIPNTTHRLLVEKLGGSDPATFVGNEGEVFYDPDASFPTLRLSDGSTAGGIAIGGTGGGESYGFQYDAFGITFPGGTVATSSSISTPIPNDEFQDGDPFAIRIYRGMDEDYVSFNFENDRLVFPDGNGRIITGGGEWTLDTANNILGFPSNDLISYDDNNGSGFDIFTYFKPIRITVAQSNVWAFSTDGSLTTPGDIIVSSGSSIGIGSEQPTASLDVQGGDIKVGVNTSTGVILTDENGVAWRLHVNTDGTLGTTLV